MADELPAREKKKSKGYTGLIIRAAIAVALCYVIYYLYIIKYLDEILKY